MRSVPVGTLLDVRRTAGTPAATLPKVLLDLRDDAGVRVEEARVRMRPAADQRRVDGEEPWARRVLARELLRRDRVDRAVAVLRPDLLGRLRPEVVHELLRDRLVGA